MAATIDRLDIGVYVQYAVRTQFLEAVEKQFHLREAGSIPPQTTIVDVLPRLSEMALIFGDVVRAAPWAYFFSPPRYRTRRRPSFATYRVVPTIGTLDDQDQDLQRLKDYTAKDEKDSKEKDVLFGLFQTIDELNEMLGYIVGRVGQFLQG